LTFSGNWILSKPKLTLGCTLSGTGGVWIGVNGEVTFSGSTPNTYSGATVVDADPISSDQIAVLKLQKTVGPAVPGDFTVVGGYDTYWDYYLWAEAIAYNDNQFSPTSNLEIKGILNCSNTVQTIGALAMDCGYIEMGNGLLTLNGDVTMDSYAQDAPSSIASVIAGHLDLGPAKGRGPTQTFTITGYEYITAAISGVAGISLRKDGSGYLYLQGANTYYGATTIAEGVLFAQNSTALGATSSGTVVASGASLVLGGNVTSAEPLVLNGSGYYYYQQLGYGALGVEDGQDSFPPV